MKEPHGLNEWADGRRQTPSLTLIPCNRSLAFNLSSHHQLRSWEQAALKCCTACPALRKGMHAPCKCVRESIPHHHSRGTARIFCHGQRPRTRTQSPLQVLRVPSRSRWVLFPTRTACAGLWSDAVARQKEDGARDWKKWAMRG